MSVNYKWQYLFYLLLFSSIAISINFYLNADYFYLAMRESQTAISARYMTINPIEYITPTVGFPWAIPMEFPIYQYLVWLISLIVPFEQIDIGKFLTLFSFLAVLFVSYKILSLLKWNEQDKFLALSLVATSPIYITYSMSFLIEQMALLFSLSFLYFSLRFKDELNWKFFILVIIFGILASLTKITTWLVFAFAVGIIFLYSIWQNRDKQTSNLKPQTSNLKPQTSNLKSIILYAVILITPLIIGYIWVVYSDYIKTLNTYGSFSTSEALRSFNFGTVEQKLSLTSWIHYLSRTYTGVFGIFGLIIPFLTIAILWKNKTNISKEIYLAFALFFIAPIIFTGIHFQHDYYANATAIALIFATFLILKENTKLIVAILFTNLIGGIVYLHLKQVNYTNNIEMSLAKTIKDVPDSTIIVFGSGIWDADLLYYSNKKGLQPSGTTDFNDSLFQRALKNTADKNISLIITRGNEYNQIAQETAKYFNFTEKFNFADGIDIYFPEENRKYLKLVPYELEKSFDEVKSLTDLNHKIVISINSEKIISAYYLNGEGNLYTFNLKDGFNIYHIKRDGISFKKLDISLERK